MPDLNIPFGGDTLSIPGAYEIDNVSAALPIANGTTPPLVFIGFGYNTPFKAVTYQSPAALKAAIRGGPAGDFVDFLCNPSGQLQGAQQVTFINVGANTQSALTLNTSGSFAAIDLLSGNYGLPSNLLQAQVQSGSSAGARLTLYDGYSGVKAVGDNLGAPFSLTYLGSTSGVTYSVVASGGFAIRLTTTSSTSGESLNIPLGPGNYTTVAQVVNYLNGTGAYNAKLLSATNGALPSGLLDAIANGAVPSGGTAVTVTAVLTDPTYWVNHFTANIASGSIRSGVTSSSGVPLVNTILTPFSGATSVPPTLSNYASGFNLALSQAAWTVFADSNASGVVQLGVQHAETASAPSSRKWRRFFTGSSIGDSVAAAISRSQGMDLIYATNVYPGIWRTSTTTGLNTLYDGLHLAGAAAGMATGNPPAIALTNKAVTGNGMEVDLQPNDIDLLQKGGVMPVAISETTGVPTILSDFTTWQNDANPENVFNQQVSCRSYLGYQVVGSLQPYTGSIAAPVTETQILNAVRILLNSLVYSPNRAYGVLASWDTASLTLVYTGAQQLAAVAVNATFVGQNRFITTTVNVQPLNIVVAGSTPQATVL